MMMGLFGRKDKRTELVAWDGDEPVIISLDDAVVAAHAGLRVECAWCWEETHPGELFPEEATSTICDGCQQRFFS
jgi:hypothetical protein